jgi:hypothetical protein
MPGGPIRKKPSGRQSRNIPSEPELDDTQVRFQEAHGAYVFRGASRVRCSKSKACKSPRRSMKRVCGATTGRQRLRKTILHWCGRSDRGLTLAALVFHLCSHGSRDARRGAALTCNRLSRTHARLWPPNAHLRPMTISEPFPLTVCCVRQPMLSMT